MTSPRYRKTNSIQYYYYVESNKKKKKNSWKYRVEWWFLGAEGWAKECWPKTVNIHIQYAGFMTRDLKYSILITVNNEMAYYLN